MSRLTDREREVLGLVVEGHQNKEIASLLNISLKTVTAHLTSIFASLGVTNRTQAAMWASGSLREQIGMHPDGPAALAATNELVEQLVAEVTRLRHAADYAIHELGVPQDELTPAPVANAYRVLVAALGEDA